MATAVATLRNRQRWISMNYIDTRVPKVIRLVLGDLYDELLQVMLDLDSPPIFLMSDDRARIADVRTRALDELRAWTTEEQDKARSLVNLLPRNMQLPDLAQSLLETGSWDEYFRLPSSTFEPPRETDRVFAALPMLLSRSDDDGLLKLDGLDVRPHGLLVGDFSLQYHQLLRRNFGSTINYDLIRSLLTLAHTGNVTARLAIDERRLRRRDEHQEIEEREYWYGPHIDEAKLDDLIALGETIHGDPECGQSLLSPYWAVSARWARDRSGPFKSIELEEFIPVDARGSGPVLVRYLHAIRDTDRLTFVHCDGAVKAYDRATYPTQLADFAGRGKGTHYRKVFRLDGQVATNDWSNVAVQWFRGNKLVSEYLEGLATAPIE